MPPWWAVTFQINQQVEPPELADTETRPTQRGTISGPGGVVTSKEWLLPWVSTGGGDEPEILNFVPVTGSSIGVGVGFLVIGHNSLFTGNIDDADPPIALGTNCTLSQIADSGPFVAFNFPSRVYAWWKIWRYEQMASNPSVNTVGSTIYARQITFQPADGVVSMTANISIDADTGLTSATRNADASQGAVGTNSALFGVANTWAALGANPVITFSFNNTVFSDVGPHDVMGVHNGEVQVNATVVRALLAAGVAVEVAAP